MGHKTITISDDAYNALAKARNDNESFTKVILRLTSQRSRAGSLLEHLKDHPPDKKLAKDIEEIMRKTRRAQLKPANLSQV